jgi:hypothetical protein
MSAVADRSSPKVGCDYRVIHAFVMGKSNLFYRFCHRLYRSNECVFEGRKFGVPLLQIEGAIRVVNHSHCRPDVLGVRYVDATDAIKVRSSTHSSNPWAAFRSVTATIVDVAYWLTGLIRNAT